MSDKNKPSELAMENIRRMWPRVVGRSRGSRWTINAHITRDLQSAWAPPKGGDAE